MTCGNNGECVLTDHLRGSILVPPVGRWAGASLWRVAPKRAKTLVLAHLLRSIALRFDPAVPAVFAVAAAGAALVVFFESLAVCGRRSVRAAYWPTEKIVTNINNSSVKAQYSPLRG